MSGPSPISDNLAGENVESGENGENASEIANETDGGCEDLSNNSESDVSYLVPPDDLAKVDLDLIEGNKPGSKWLVIEKTYICHVNAGSTEGDVTYWECRRRRHDRYFI